MAQLSGEYPLAATRRKNEHLFHLCFNRQFFLGLSRKIIREKLHQEVASLLTYWMDYTDLVAKISDSESGKPSSHLFKLPGLSILPSSNTIVQNIPIYPFVFIQLSMIQFMPAFQVSISVQFLCDGH